MDALSEGAGVWRGDWQAGSRGESGEEARLPSTRGPGGGRGRLAPSRGLYKCGERLLALEGQRLTLATGPGRTDWLGRRDSAA